MARITYVQHDGASSEFDIDTGWSVMEGAVKNGIPGIDADCGGVCACATCHVFVDAAWIATVGEPTGQEAEMLEVVENRQPTSRLSCQIEVDDALDGLVVRLPEHQH